MISGANKNHTTQSDPINLRLLTFNIRFGSGGLIPDKQGYDLASSDKKLAALADAICSVEPDIAALQEVRGCRQAEILARKINSGYAYVSHGSSYSLNFFEWGLAILSRHKLAETASRSIYFDKDVRVGRLSLLTHAAIQAKIVRVINVHFHHGNYDSQVQTVMALLEESDLPTVLVGDFNCSPENPALEPIRRQLTDTCLAAGTTNARAALARGTLLYGQSRIDYIFVDPAFFSVSDAGLIAGKHHQVSDHLGYYSALKFKPPHT